MTERSKRTVAGRTLIALPVLLLVAAIVHPSHRAWDSAVAVAASQRERWYLGHLLILGAMALLALAVLWLGRALRGPRGGLESTGAALTMVGAIGVGALAGVELVVREMSDPSLNQGAMAALGERMASSPALIVPLFSMLAALGLGICLLALALERSRTGPPRAALVGGIALAIAIVAFPLPAVAIPAAICSLAGLGSVGWTMSTSAPEIEPAAVPR